MSIPLDTPTETTSGPPAIKLTTPEVSEVVVGIVDIGEYQQRDIDTGESEWWDAAKTEPKMGKILTGLVVSAVACSIKENDADRAVVAGDLVSFWIEKGKYYTYRDALLDAGKADRGGVMKWWREADKPKKNPAHSAPHTYVAKIRPPEAKDGDLADRCEAAYHEQAKRPALDAAPSADPFPPKYDAAEGF